MTKTAVFGGGCFWCTEAVYKMLKGVTSVEPGYAGGTTPRPAYEEVCTGRTGHAEVIKVEYDPALISYRELLAVFFATHDPTTLNRQGNDVGTQYRSIILAADEEQRQAAQDFITELESAQPGGDRIVTEVVPLGPFYPAENYHRDYYAKNQDAPYCRAIITPKVLKAKQRFAALIRKQEK